MKAHWIAGSVLLLVAASAPLGTVHAQYQPAQPGVVECSSSNGRIQRCPVDARGGVVLQTQYSRSGCYQNETWGFDATGVWVSNGCRASFLVGQPPQNHSSGKNTAAAVAAVALIAAAVLAANKDKDDHNSGPVPNDRDAAREYNGGCDAARAGAQLPSYASPSYRNGYMACLRR
ncbi:DUF3011 domain-containing protein [Noviluteimonas gilva]|nr:DUF3011 domain-containing protein [Lysobacter gilvus]